MGSRLDVVVFDVNETLPDMAPLADRFTEVGAPGMQAAWLDRRATPYPGHFTQPDIIARTLDELATLVIRASR